MRFAPIGVSAPICSRDAGIKLSSKIFSTAPTLKALRLTTVRRASKGTEPTWRRIDLSPGLNAATQSDLDAQPNGVIRFKSRSDPQQPRSF